MRKPTLSVVLVCSLTISTAAYAVTLSGTVTDNDGPVAGALVHAVPITPDGSARAGTVTDADGRFLLIVERHPSRLIVSKAGRVTTIVNVRQGSRHVDVELAREGRALRGRIVDHREQPVPDALIAITQIKQPREQVPPRLPGNHFIDALRARSGWDGTFEIRGLPAWEELILEVRKREFATVIEEIGPEAALEYSGQTLISSPTRMVQIVMPPEARLSGTVTWRGLPMKGLEVSARRGEDWSSTTDDRGRFQIGRLPPGEVRLSVRTDETMALASSLPTMRLAPGDRIDDIEIELVQTAVITGTVTRADTEEPVRGAQIGHPTPSVQRGGTTGEDGRYVLRVLPGAQTIMFLRAGPMYQRSPNSPDPRPGLTVDVEAGQFLDGVDFSVEPWLLGDVTFAGRLRLPDGTPAGEATVDLQPPLMPGSMRRGAEVGHTVTTDGAGRFELRPRLLRLEEFYLLRARSATGELIAARVVPGSGADGIEISLHEPAYVRLPVEWEDDTAHSPDGLDLSVWARAPREAMLPLSAEQRREVGEIVLGPLPPHLTIVFRAYGGAFDRIRSWGPMTLSLRPGEALNLPRLVAIRDDGPWLTGRVVDEDGRAVEGATVLVSPWYMSARPVTTGPDGSFRIQARSTHRDRLGLIAATEDGASCVGIWLGDQTEGEHVLQLAAPASVSGRVFSVDGRPSVGVSVKARAVWDGESSIVGGILRTDRSVQTDAAGRFRIDGLIPGLPCLLTVEDRIIKAEAEHYLRRMEPGEQEPVELRLRSRE